MTHTKSRAERVVADEPARHQEVRGEGREGGKEADPFAAEPPSDEADDDDDDGAEQDTDVPQAA
jgi:hypothetical protein